MAISNRASVSVCSMPNIIVVAPTLESERADGGDGERAPRRELSQRGATLGSWALSLTLAAHKALASTTGVAHLTLLITVVPLSSTPLMRCEWPHVRSILFGRQRWMVLLASPFEVAADQPM